MPSLLAIYTENGPFINYSCGIAPPAFATLGMQSALLTAAQNASAIVTSVCSEHARISFRTFPSGATLALTHTNLVCDEHDDSARLAAIYEFFVSALGASAMSDASKFDKAAFRRLSDQLRAYVDVDSNALWWQTTLKPEFIVPALPLLTSARSFLNDISSDKMSHIALMHRHQCIASTSAWMSLDPRDQLHISVAGSARSETTESPHYLLYSSIGEQARVEYRIAIVSISADLKAVAVVNVENAASLGDLVKARPTMVANLVDLHRQSTSELQRGIPNSIALEASIQGFVLLHRKSRTFWFLRNDDWSAIIRQRLQQHVDAARREFTLSTVGEDSVACATELSEEFADGSSVYALNTDSHELHVAFDATAPVNIRRGLVTMLLESTLKHVQNACFVFEK